MLPLASASDDVIATVAIDVLSSSNDTTRLVEADGVYGVISFTDQSGASAEYLSDKGIPVTGWHVGVPAWSIYPNMFTYRLPPGDDPPHEINDRTFQLMADAGATKVAIVGGGNPQSTEFVERNVAWAARKIDESERPSLLKATTTKLPRTADKKVKRPEALALLVALTAEAPHVHDALATTKPQALAPSEVLPREGATVVEDRLPAPGRKKTQKQESDAPLAVPEPVKKGIKGLLGGLQKAFYDTVPNPEWTV